LKRAYYISLHYLQVKKFKGKVGIDIREMYEKGGEFLPGRKGIYLNTDDWDKLKGLMDKIDQAIEDA